MSQTTDDTRVSDFKRIYAKANPIPVFFGPIPNTSEYRIAFEIVANKNFSYQFAGSYLSKSIIIGAFVPDSLKGILKQFEYPGSRIQLQLRYYFLKIESDATVRDMLKPSGLYLALHGSYAQAVLKIKNTNYPRDHWHNLTANALIGAQFINQKDFGIDLFFGLGYKSNRVFHTDYFERTTEVDIKSSYDSPLGDYLASSLKVSCGFHICFGLL